MIRSDPGTGAMRLVDNFPLTSTSFANLALPNTSRFPSVSSVISPAMKRMFPCFSGCKSKSAPKTFIEFSARIKLPPIVILSDAERSITLV